MFPAGGHLGSDADMLDIIFKGDHPRTIVINRLIYKCLHEEMPINDSHLGCRSGRIL